MALSYKNLWKQLIDRDMTRKDLHRISGVSHATLAKMSRGESVTASVLERICTSLNCKIEDVMEITPDQLHQSHEELEN
jgi:DNA-binding Xre family transcriptional regulator